MCGLCGIFDGGRRWMDAAAILDSATFRRERLRRVDIIRGVLAPVRVGVDDWEGASFLVRGPTGAVEIVDNLFDLWRKAESLSGRRLDPLAEPADPAADAS
jgi:hypothetical protein